MHFESCKFIFSLSAIRRTHNGDNGRKVISSGSSSSRNIGLQAAKLKTRFRPHTCNNSTVRIGSYESILSSSPPPPSKYWLSNLQVQ